MVENSYLVVGMLVRAFVLRSLLRSRCRVHLSVCPFSCKREQVWRASNLISKRRKRSVASWEIKEPRYLKSVACSSSSSLILIASCRWTDVGPVIGTLLFGPCLHVVVRKSLVNMCWGWKAAGLPHEELAQGDISVAKCSLKFSESVILNVIESMVDNSRSVGVVDIIVRAHLFC